MKIIYPNGSGGICVVHPTGELPIEQVAFKDVPEGADWRYAEDDEIPSDRTFRNAWVLNHNGAICIDMPKARDIFRGFIREARKPLLEALDVAYLRADEVRDRRAKYEIVVLKQALRDAPNSARIDAASSPEDLLAIRPMELFAAMNFVSAPRFKIAA